MQPDDGGGNAAMVRKGGLMKISMIQMDMHLGDPNYNFKHACDLIEQAMALECPDVITLPETWNVGFFPKTNLEFLSDDDLKRTRELLGTLASRYSVNLVAGSVANRRQSEIYNTACVFNRLGDCIASYDKIHLFSPMKEDSFFSKGNRLCVFSLDGVRCGLVICYDIRFCELIRATALQGIDLLFVVAQWPDVRLEHWQVLNTARAIENQVFVSCTNSCGYAGETHYGGSSMLINPFGQILARGGMEEEIITSEIDLSILADIRNSIHVYRDRRPELYQTFFT